MRGIRPFVIALAAMNGLGISALFSQTPKLQTVPLTADIDVVSVRNLPDGNTLRQERKLKFYRRADGSTRLEEANRVVIVDNIAQTVAVLDPVAKTAQVQANPTAPSSGRRPAAIPTREEASGSLNETASGAGTDLGVKLVAGYKVRGIQRTATIPANSALGNAAPIAKTIEIWKSSDLRLPLLTTISDPLGGTTTSQYQNISTASPPDDSLFAIPAGYKVVQTPQSRILESHTN